MYNVSIIGKNITLEPRDEKAVYFAMLCLIDSNHGHGNANASHTGAARRVIRTASLEIFRADTDDLPGAGSTSTEFTHHGSASAAAFFFESQALCSVL